MHHCLSFEDNRENDWLSVIISVSPNTDTDLLGRRVLLVERVQVQDRIRRSERDIIERHYWTITIPGHARAGDNTRGVPTNPTYSFSFEIE